jgi:hypothetical protein
VIKPLLQSVPLMAGEIGQSDCQAGYINPLMAYLDAQGGHYLAWAWNTYDCGGFPALISSHDGTPTGFGMGFRNHLLTLAGRPLPPPPVVPFFSGAFDDPNFDDVKHPTAQAGMTCTVCHAITNIQDTRGNANYTIEEPVHYPFAKSDNSALQWINNQMVKAKPSFHKKTFLKPLHKTAEFCSTCHKVHLPPELNDYKWLRGQNHYDTFLLSGVSGHGARSFYYPLKAQENCNTCHMPLAPSQDFGAKFFGSDKLSVHNHLFPAANTGLAYIRNQPQIVTAHQEFLKGVMRVDIFGLRENGAVDGKLIAPLRPTVPTLKAGQKYLLETVIRTVKMGHPFTQGTVDSNEVWMDLTVRSGDRIIGRSGALDSEREVDPWSHFVNVFMLDREGNRIARRNPQDIFVPLYNNQIPPGAAATVHYEMQLPEQLNAPVTIEVKLQYRKFDKQYMDFVTGTSKPGDNPINGFTRGQKYLNNLPITTLAIDTLTLPVEGITAAPANPPSAIPPWQRWNVTASAAPEDRRNSPGGRRVHQVEDER